MAQIERRRRGRPAIQSPDQIIQRIVTRTGPALRLGDVTRLTGLTKYNLIQDIKAKRLRGHRVTGYGTQGFEYCFAFDDVRAYVIREGFVPAARFI